MPKNNAMISKLDWQYIIAAFALGLIFISTDVFRILDKNNLVYYSRLISYQPHRIFTSALIHADITHLIMNLGGILMVRFFLMGIGLRSKTFFLQFILIGVYVDFLITWLYERILYVFFNYYSNIAVLGFSGIICAFFGFILLSSIFGKKNFLGLRVDLKRNIEIHKMSKTICLISLFWSFLPGISLIGHLTGFIAGCLMFLV